MGTSPNGSNGISPNGTKKCTSPNGTAEWESGRYAGYISNANAFTGPLEDANFYADILDFALSKIHPLYNKVCEGDTIVTVRRHKGGYKGISQKEYKFYFGQDKSNFYYVK